MDESEELSGLEGILVLTWVSLAVISYTKNKQIPVKTHLDKLKHLTVVSISSA